MTGGGDRVGEVWEEGALSHHGTVPDAGARAGAPATDGRTLVIIPARGGSKGIPRKNLRSLAGRPLIAYAIETALASRHQPDVYVSSDDEEILGIAAKLGARTHRRDPALAVDETTLDEVIAATYASLVAAGAGPYGVVVTLQPTSPLLATATLDDAIDIFDAEPDVETVLTVTDDTHLTWERRNGALAPAYERRVNRQLLPPVYRETGGLIMCRSATLATGSRIGRTAVAVEVSGGEAIDIDDREDWALCEHYLTHGDLLFVVAGNAEIGLGHVYNALTLANELVRHRIRFLVTAGSDLAYDAISAQHYEVHRQRTADLVEEIALLHPRVVINDRLDTSADEIRRLKERRIAVANFEDLGAGAREADLVINAIYPERDTLPGHHFGARYFLMRQEFLLTRPRQIAETVGSVLVTFGGVDPLNLTRKVVGAIYQICRARAIELTVIAGRGYREQASLSAFPEIRLLSSVATMADHMRAADIAFTSAGRTAFEVAALGTPTIVLAQNEREMTHLFATDANGFMHLGPGGDVDDDEIRAAFVCLLDDAERRRAMQERMLATDLRGGTSIVSRLIEGLIDDAG